MKQQGSNVMFTRWSQYASCRQASYMGTPEQHRIQTIIMRMYQQISNLPGDLLTRIKNRIFNIELTPFNLRDILMRLLTCQTYIVQFDQRLHDKSRTTGNIDDESSLLKLKFYLLSSADSEQRQYQWQLTVKEKKVVVRQDVRPTHPVRQVEEKKARQRSTRKQATSKNRGARDAPSRRAAMEANNESLPQVIPKIES